MSADLIQVRIQDLKLKMQRFEDASGYGIMLRVGTYEYIPKLVVENYTRIKEALEFNQDLLFNLSNKKNHKGGIYGKRSSSYSQ